MTQISLLYKSNKISLYKCMDVIFTSSCFIQLVGANINFCALRFQFILSLFGKVKKSFWICESNLHGNFSSRYFCLNLQWFPELSTIGDILTTRNYMLLSRIAFRFHLNHLGQDLQVLFRS